MANPYMPWLEEEPEQLYRGFLSYLGDLGGRFAQSQTNRLQPRTSRAFLDYWGNQYNKVYNDYLGKLSQQALGGQAPNLKFWDYLQGPLVKQSGYGGMNPLQRLYMGNPMMQEWQEMAPWTRGEMNVPGLRWNIPR